MLLQENIELWGGVMKTNMTAEGYNFYFNINAVERLPRLPFSLMLQQL